MKLIEKLEGELLDDLEEAEEGWEEYWKNLQVSPAQFGVDGLPRPVFVSVLNRLPHVAHLHIRTLVLESITGKLHRTVLPMEQVLVNRVWHRFGLKRALVRSP